MKGLKRDRYIPHILMVKKQPKTLETVQVQSCYCGGFVEYI